MRNRVLLLLIAAGTVAADRSPTSAEQWHAYADGVLAHKFFAAMNDFQFKHPQDREGDSHKWEHVRTMDAGDMKRFRELDKAYSEWRSAMKNAGY